MHRIITPAGVTRQSRFLRIVLALAYVSASLAGLLLYLSPEITLAYGGISHWFAAFMAVGGLLAALGTVTMRWVGEYTGLPLLVPALAAFALGVADHGEGSLPTTASALILTSIALILTARWRVSAASARFTHAAARAEKALSR